jgi:hypothetical protein
MMDFFLFTAKHIFTQYARVPILWKIVIGFKCCVRVYLIFTREQRPNQKKNMVHVWDPMPEMTITSPYVHSRVDSSTFTMGNPMPESTLTLCQSRLYLPVRDFGFGHG